MKLQRRLMSNTAEVNQLTDKDGLDRSYSADNDLSIIDNTVYIAGTHMHRASDWYDDFGTGANTLEYRPNDQSIYMFYVWNGSSTIHRGFSKAGR